LKAISVTCPHCGARLNVPGTAVQALCEYCGTASRLQRRTGVLERVMPPADAPNLPVPIAVQRRTMLVPILFAAALVISGGVMAVGMSGRHSRQPAPPTRQQAITSHDAARIDAAIRIANPTWDAGGRPLLADIDGDGTVEILGRGRRGDDTMLVAIDQQGTPRWTSEPIGTYMATYTVPLVIADNLLVFGGTRGDLRAFGLADGKQRWTAQLPERTRSFCDGGSILIAVGADDERRGVRLSDGSSVPVPAERKPTCAPLPTDREPHVPNSATRDLARKHDIGGFEHSVHDLGGGSRLLAGKRGKGTGVPTLVAVDAGGEELWRAELPPDPLAANQEAPTQVAIGEGVVCATFHPGSSTEALDLTCFDRSSGIRTWTQRLTSHYVGAMLPIGTTLLLSMWGNLEMRDLATGAVRWNYSEH
jgi:outer membrane protein assembly factor BamB